MERRRFLMASGATLLGTSAYTISQEPVVAVSFEISGIPSEDPSNINSVSFEFEEISIIPHYLDESQNIDVSANLKIEDVESHAVSAENLQFQNGEKINLSDINTEKPDFNPILIDNINSTSNYLDGSIQVSVEHPDVRESYNQSFRISPSESPTGRSSAVSGVFFSRDTDTGGNQMSTYADAFKVDSTTLLNFESGSTSEWNKDLNNSTFSTTTSTTFEGTYAGEWTINWDSASEQATYDVQNTQGDEYSFMGRFSDAPNGDFWWGWEDPNGNNLFEFIFVRQTSSNKYPQFRSNSSKEMASFTLNPSTWYKFIVRPDWKNATVEYEIQDTSGNTKTSGQIPFDPTIRFSGSSWSPPNSVTRLVTDNINNTDYNGGIRKGLGLTQVPNTSQLQRYYPLQETSGSTANDISNNTNGSYHNTNLGQSGPLSTNAPYFNGSSSYADTNYRNNPSSGSIFLTAYIPSDSNGGNIFGMDSTRPRMAYISSNNETEFTIYDGSSQNPVVHQNPPKDEWITYIINFGTSNGIELYANGTQVDTNNYTGTWHFLDRSNMLIGATTDPSNDPKGYFDGKVWSWMLWENINLTSSEVQSLHDQLTSDGSLLTKTIKTGFKIKPNFKNLDYNLNGGSIELELIGSPTSSEPEKQSATLDGANSYDISWNNSHKEFRLNVSITSPDRKISPELFNVGIE